MSPGCSNASLLLGVLSIQVIALEMHVDHNHHVAYMLWQKQFVTMISFEMFAKILTNACIDA